jgi:hypothetical protein
MEIVLIFTRQCLVRTMETLSTSVADAVRPAAAVIFDTLAQPVLLTP